jgi:hypothetical protein
VVLVLIAVAALLGMMWHYLWRPPLPEPTPQPGAAIVAPAPIAPDAAVTRTAEGMAGASPCPTVSQAVASGGRHASAARAPREWQGQAPAQRSAQRRGRRRAARGG